MKLLDPKIVEICQRSKVSQYLQSRGVEVLQSGSRQRCKCPIGTHADRDPSFYIWTLPDGTEMFKCFGCLVAGNIITIMSILEKQTKGMVVRDLSAKLGISLSQFNFSVPMEPQADEVDELFCDEQDVTMQIGEIVVPFLQAHPTLDAVQKISRMYQQLERMMYVGDIEGVHKYRDMLFQAVEEYQ
jgi:DNA primase